MDAAAKEVEREAARERMASPVNKGKDRKRKAAPDAKLRHQRHLADARSKIDADLGHRRGCPHCGAPVWKAETTSGCVACGGGAHVARRLPPPPGELLRWEGDETLNPWTHLRPGGTRPWDARTEIVERKGRANADDRDDGPRAAPAGAGMVRLAGRVYHY
eukprot:gene1195-7889_t